MKRLSGLAAVVSLLAIGFALAGEAESVKVTKPVDTKDFKPSWSPTQAIGKPDVPADSDDERAWAAAERDSGTPWLQVEFEKAVKIAEIRIRESHCPGGVSKVTALQEGVEEIQLWQGKDPTETAPADFVVTPDKNLQVTAKTLRIYINAAHVSGWEEIDAVELIGQDESRQWAVSATASSYYGEGSLIYDDSFSYRAYPVLNGVGYAASQATGAPDTPAAGDYSTAWLAASPADGGPEWLRVGFEKPAAIAEVRIRESCNPGSITKVTARTADRKTVTLWEGRYQPASDITDLVIKPTEEIASAIITIHIDTSLVSGWNEIDAVELVGKDGSRQWANRAKASSHYGESQPSVNLDSLLRQKVTIQLTNQLSVAGKVHNIGGEFIELRGDEGHRMLVNKQQILMITYTPESSEDDFENDDFDAPVKTPRGPGAVFEIRGAKPE